MADAAGVTRRGALAHAGAALGALAAVPAPANASSADPRRSAVGQIKMEACLDGSLALWTYGGTIYAVRPGERPRAILGVAGGSASWAMRRPDGSWRMAGATVSFFRDVASGAFLDAFDNPFTGRRDAVRANALSGGGMVFPADGTAPHFVGRSKAGETTPGGFAEADPARPLGRVEWVEAPGTILLMTDHAFEVPVQPQLEARTIFADRAAFLDPRLERMPARVTTTTIVPWLRWMEMADAPGHLVWHCSGVKLFDVAALPADYRARAGALLDLFGAPSVP